MYATFNLNSALFSGKYLNIQQ